MVSSATNQDFQKRFNRALLLDALRARPHGISRVELAEQLGLKKSSISNITAELIDRGLVIERSLEPGTERERVGAGRRPVPLTLNAEFTSVLGIEIQPARYRATVMDLYGDIAYRTGGSIVAPRAEFGDVCHDVLHRVFEEVSEGGFTPAGVGIGMPGYIRSADGHIIYSQPHDVRDFPFTTRFASTFPAPIVVDNDANCGAWGEIGLDRDSPIDDFLFMLGEYQDRSRPAGSVPGLSLGFGLVLNGWVYEGSRHSAGDFKSVHWRTGNHSQTGIPDEQIRDIRTNERIRREYLVEILTNLSTISSVLDPSRVVIGGDLATHLPEIQLLTDTELERTHLSERAGDNFFRPARFGVDAVAAGAAAMVLEDLFGGLIRPNPARAQTLDWDPVLAGEYATDTRPGRDTARPGRDTKVGEGGEAL